MYDWGVAYNEGDGHRNPESWTVALPHTREFSLNPEHQRIIEVFSLMDYHD